MSSSNSSPPRVKHWTPPSPISSWISPTRYNDPGYVAYGNSPLAAYRSTQSELPALYPDSPSDLSPVSAVRRLVEEFKALEPLPLLLDSPNVSLGDSEEAISLGSFSAGDRSIRSVDSAEEAEVFEELTNAAAFSDAPDIDTTTPASESPDDAQTQIDSDLPDSVSHPSDSATDNGAADVLAGSEADAATSDLDMSQTCAAAPLGEYQLTRTTSGMTDLTAVDELDEGMVSLHEKSASEMSVDSAPLGKAVDIDDHKLVADAVNVDYNAVVADAGNVDYNTVVADVVNNAVVANANDPSAAGANARRVKDLEVENAAVKAQLADLIEMMTILAAPPKVYRTEPLAEDPPVISRFRVLLEEQAKQTWTAEREIAFKDLNVVARAGQECGSIVVDETMFLVLGGETVSLNPSRTVLLVHRPKFTYSAEESKFVRTAVLPHKEYDVLLRKDAQSELLVYAGRYLLTSTRGIAPIGIPIPADVSSRTIHALMKVGAASARYAPPFPAAVQTYECGVPWVDPYIFALVEFDVESYHRLEAHFQQEGVALDAA
ncbi:hypothetical protein MKEN_00477600 [Mycena kentingensis (nom. inval.)]|nr:hypothetical protein MKEN_00477600 [Mycena kentingensis (nom. inval.)]